MERIWGGRRLATLYGLPLPPEKPVGEAWLISDHPVHTSIVAAGPLTGKTLSELLHKTPSALLGTLPGPTRHGRFPLLLKLLDAAEILSVQVHPDDATAEQMNEPDDGKTEMWHILEAVPGAQLITGVAPGCTPALLEQAARAGNIEPYLMRETVRAGDSVFVPAGTVHAIGAGIVLAEIQQNSDLTYRIYDYGRKGPDGKARELHLGRACRATRFGFPPAAVVRPAAVPCGEAMRARLAVCPFFTADHYAVEGACEISTRHESFHLVLGVSGSLTVAAGGAEIDLSPGTAVLIPGEQPAFSLTGTGSCLDYFVSHAEASAYPSS